MFKPIPVAIGLRYLRAKRRNGFISFISMASILGIALGVTVLITTLAVMSGFRRKFATACCRWLPTRLSVQKARRCATGSMRSRSPCPIRA